MTDSTLQTDVAHASPVARMLSLRRAWLTMDKNPEAIRFVASPPGIVAVHLAFFSVLLLAGLNLGFGTMAVAIAGLIGCAIAPSRRALVISLSTIAFLLIRPFQSPELASIPPAAIAQFGLTGFSVRGLTISGTVLFMGFAWLALLAQDRFRERMAAKRPVLTLMFVFWALVALALSGLISGMLLAVYWTFLAAFAAGFWFLAYALADQKAKDPSSTATRLGLFRPFWGGPPLPTGKGAAYLRKFEAKDNASLAVTRLRGLKLLVWGVLLTGLNFVSMRLIHQDAGLPTLGQSLQAYADGATMPAYEGWSVLVVHYLLEIVVLAGWSHIIVAIIRMAGYGIPRNTVRPLASRSLAEFWNRYYFYFKELLVDFFFFPAFLRYFKKQPKLRVAFATLCAASFGNVLFHFGWNLDLTFNYGILGAISHFQSYIVYSLLLAGGLIISQLRKTKAKPADGFWRYDVMPRLGVGLFFCLIAIFDEMPTAFSMHDRIAFLFSLFGVT